MTDIKQGTVGRVAAMTRQAVVIAFILLKRFHRRIGKRVCPTVIEIVGRRHLIVKVPGCPDVHVVPSYIGWGKTSQRFLHAPV